jgi:imidazole glycerol-phosphate synthase subunit HisH
VIAIVDYRMGNLRSVQKGFEAAGVGDVLVSDDPAVIGAADAIVLPGVGAFRDASANLAASGLDGLLKDRVAAGVPLLGICLGMQLLVTTGLGLVPGVCDRLPGGVKIPHMGWNTLAFPKGSPLFAGVPEGEAFYFVHSYRVVPDEASDAAAVTEYGVAFVSALAARNVYGVQFHPEKSSTMGLRVLSNFGRIAAAAADGSGVA